VGCVLKVKWLAVGPSGLQKINFGPLFESLQNSASNDIGPRIFDRRRGCRSDSDRGPMSFTGVVLKTSKKVAVPVPSCSGNHNWPVTVAAVLIDELG